MLIPTPTQAEHIARLVSILKRLGAALDTSYLGSGKTLTSLMVAKHFNVPALVICTKSGKHTWTELAKEMRVPLVDTLSYDQLRSRKGTIRPNRYIIRNDDETKPSFTPSDEFQALVRKGVLIVFDEIHKIRNRKADQQLASHCLTHYIHSVHESQTKNNQTWTAFALGLSGSPSYDEAGYVSHLRFLGVIKHPKLFEHEKNGAIRFLGLRDVFDKCREVDTEKTKPFVTECMKRPPFDLKSAEAIVLKAYTRILRDAYVSAMPRSNDRARLEVYHAQFSLEGKPLHKEKYIQALNGLASELWNVNLKEENMVEALSRRDGSEFLQSRDPDAKKKSHTSRGKELFRALELSLTPTVIEYMIKRKQVDPRMKLVFMCTFRRTAACARDLFISYFGEDEVVLNDGQLSEQERAYNIQRFQTRSLPDEDDEDEEDPHPRKISPIPPASVFIGTIQTNAESISLHDVYGDEPRLACIMNTSDIMLAHQAVGRFARVGSKGTAFVYVCSGSLSQEEDILRIVKNETEVVAEDACYFGIEANMMRALARRADVMSQTLNVQKEDGVLFPGEYPHLFIEADMDD